jgi:hypothetical protein
MNAAGDLKNDIYALQTCKDEITYLKATELFVDKWSNSGNSFIPLLAHLFQ